MEQEIQHGTAYIDPQQMAPILRVGNLLRWNFLPLFAKGYTAGTQLLLRHANAGNHTISCEASYFEALPC